MPADRLLLVAMGWLDGRVAIVTGASKGIGRAVSRAFAKEGAAVICAARSAVLVEETAQSIRDEGGRAVAVVADLSTEEGARHVVERGAAAFGHVDCLINNAATAVRPSRCRTTRSTSGATRLIRA